MFLLLHHNWSGRNHFFFRIKSKAMFGDLFGNMEERQKEMQEKLATIQVEVEVGDGAVKVVATGDQRILDISIDKDALDWEDHEQVEDLLMTAVNRALEIAGEKAAAASQEMLKDMMPPGFGGLSNLFGG